jgi:hypothetical protein
MILLLDVPWNGDCKTYSNDNGPWFVCIGGCHSKFLEFVSVLWDWGK